MVAVFATFRVPVLVIVPPGPAPTFNPVPAITDVTVPTVPEFAIDVIWPCAFTTILLGVAYVPAVTPVFAIANVPVLNGKTLPGLTAHNITEQIYLKSVSAMRR